MEKFDLSILIPCLNEEENIATILNEIKSVIELNSLNAEIIVVDDRSQDETLKQCLKWREENTDIPINILHKDLERRGYGAVLKYGLPYSQAKYATFVSADNVDPIYLLPEMLRKLKDEGNDLIQCSRYLNPEDSITIPFKYKFYQFFFRFGVKIALRKSIPDSTYAFKMFDKRKIQGLGISSNRFNISPEIMFKTILAGYKYDFVKGGQGVRKNGVSKFNFTLEGPGFLYCLIRAFLHRKRIIFWF